MPYQLALKLACQTVKNGGVIAYPTEGVFGLGCDPFNQQAVERILTIKQRPVEKGVILIAQHIDQLLPYLATLSAEQRAKLDASWPGPFTWVIQHNGRLPYWVTGGRDTVAVRVTNHPTAAALCHQLGAPLVSTSANRSGRNALTTRIQVTAQLANELDFIVPGRVQTPGQASQITDLTSGQTFRG